MAEKYVVQIKENGRWKTVTERYNNKVDAFATRTWHVAMGREARVMRVTR